MVDVLFLQRGIMDAKWILLVTAAIGCTGCVIEHAGPAEHDTSSVERDNNAKLVRVNLNMGAGTLRVEGGANKLAEANFTYNSPWKPELRYSSSAGYGNLTIGEPEREHGVRTGKQENEWDVHMNRDVPLEIAAHLGAGQANLNLGGLTLRNVEVEMGAGQLDLDLRGKPETSYDVRVRGGVGEATVRVPSSVGVEASVHGGIGEIEASGLHGDKHRYYNDAYGTSKVSVRVDIEGGVGSIKLIAE